MCLFMTILVVALSITVSAENINQNTSDVSDKISGYLYSKLNSMDETEMIKVSIWFSDINYGTVRSTVEASLENEKIRTIGVSQDAIDLVFLNDSIANSNTQATLNSIAETYSGVSTEEVQAVIERERMVVTDMYETHNNLMIENTLGALSGASLLMNGTTASQVSYVSRYAPNIEAYLTKAEILEIADSNLVEAIYSIETDAGNIANADFVVTVEEDDDLDEPKDMTFFEVTGLATARDMWGLTGLNMKVGMVEDDGLPRTSISNTATITHVYTSNDYTTTDNHATLVADIMVGRSIREDGVILFEGAIPSANLYCASVDDESDIKVAVESLLDEGVTAINCSFSYPTYNVANNVYGDIAKWYDHISAQHNVHLILSASNYGSAGIPRTNVSYNAIVVGACDNNGTILTDSSYITLNNFMNKPDMVAPGIVSSMQYGNAGTSFAAPMVTSAVIQLSEASSVLMANPTLMKAVLLGNSKITNAMNNDANIISTTTNTNSAISQVYGTGMLNVTKAYTSFMNDLYYKTSSMSPYTNTINYQKNITKVTGKTLRFCLSWNKMNSITGDHITGAINNATLDKFQLTVTTPSGVVYTSQNLYDNKQVITFEATENGYYSYKIDRIGTGTSGGVVRFSVAYSKQ